MTLDEIRVLLRFKDAPHENCAQVNDLLDEHIDHVATRIKELKALERQLKTLRERCRESQQASQCGILTELSSASRHLHEPATRRGPCSWLCCTNPRADALTPTPDGLMPRHPPARSAAGRSD